MDSPSKILIVLFGAIGDVTRALPLAVRIKKSWPNAKLFWAIEPPSRGLVEGHPAIDRVLLFDRPRGFSAYCKLITEIRREKFDLVLDLQRHLKSGTTSWLSGARRRIGFNRENSREGNWIFNSECIERAEHFSPKIFQFQHFGDKLGIAPLQPLEFGLEPAREKLDAIEKLINSAAKGENSLPEKRVALILGSTWPSRFWFVEHYVRLIEEIYRRWGFTSVLVGGSGERKFADEIIRGIVGVPYVDLVEKTAISDLSAVFSLVRAVVGSDSGPMHIAAAVGKPVISLWGSTSPKRSAPYGSEQLVIKSPVSCSPCYKRVCPGLGTICMFDIPSHAVVESLDRVIGNESIR